MLEKNRLSFIVLIAGVIGIAAYYLGLFTDLTADAGKYATIARHMFESGDLINLKIHGEAYDQKPPLIFWLATLGFKLGGLNNFSYKIFQVLYGFLGIFFTYKLGESLHNKAIGKIAAYFLFFSQFYFLYCMDIHTDLLIQTNVTLAIWQLSEYLKNKKVLNFVLAFVGTGLAILSKGPIGAAVPAFALCTHLILKKDFKQLFHPKWILGILIATIVASPALIGLYNQFGLEGIKFFIWTNNVGRISGEYVNLNNTDLFFYVHNLLYLYAPWAFLLALSVFWGARSFLKAPLKQESYLITGGTLFYFIIISLAKAKSPNYIFIIIPLLTILTAKWTYLLSNKPESKAFKTFRLFQNIYFALLCSFMILLMSYLFPPSKPTYLYLTISIIALCIYIYIQKGHVLEKLLLPSILIIAITNLYISTNIYPLIFSYQAATKATRIYNEMGKPEDSLYNYLYPQYELFFYSKTNAIQLNNTDRIKDVVKKGNAWIYTNNNGLDSLNLLNAPIDTIYELQNKGMNHMGIKFILPKTREESLNKMYLIRINNY